MGIMGEDGFHFGFQFINKFNGVHEIEIDVIKAFW
jgi:hypothetical protein